MLIEMLPKKQQKKNSGTHSKLSFKCRQKRCCTKLQLFTKEELSVQKNS